jgi:hypothetical protein
MNCDILVSGEAAAVMPETGVLDVNFQEVVHSARPWTLMLPNLSDSRRTEWTPTRMLP